MTGLANTLKQINWVQINKRLLDILQAWWARHHHRLPPVANVLIVVALGGYLAQLTWLAIPLPQEQGPQRALPVLSQVNVSQAQSANRSLSAQHIFGEAAMAPPADQLLAPYTAPETQLRLTLLGVFASTNKNSAWAIISDQGGGEETYAVGANVPGGATVHEILPDRVVLLRNGRYETLNLPKDGVEGEISMGRGVNRAPSGPMGMGGNRVYVTPEVAASLREYRSALLNDPQSVMDVLRAEPYRDGGGQLKGYRVFPGRDKQIMDKVGLRPGDVVTSVNGVPLDNPLKGLEIMRDLGNASEVAVQVLRNGTTQSLVVPVN